MAGVGAQGSCKRARQHHSRTTAPLLTDHRRSADKMRARRAVGTWWSRCMMKRWLGSRLGLSEGERASNSVVLDYNELTERTERSCRGERSKCGTHGARTDVASGFGAEGGERGKQLYVSCEVSGRGAKQPTALAAARPPAAAAHRPEGLYRGRCVQELARCRAAATAG